MTHAPAPSGEGTSDGSHGDTNDFINTGHSNVGSGGGLLIGSARVRDALIQALADEYSRKIILQTITQPKSISDLSEREGIPLSTAYRRVNEMKDSGILIVEKTILTSDGKKFELYRSAFRSVEIKFDQGELVIDAVLNEDIAERLSRIWSTLRG